MGVLSLKLLTGRGGVESERSEEGGGAEGGLRCSDANDANEGNEVRSAKREGAFANEKGRHSLRDGEEEVAIYLYFSLTCTSPHLI